MAQFDVHRAGDGTLVVNCQSDFISSLPTRYVIPLYQENEAQWVLTRLTPKIRFGEEDYTLATPLGAAADLDDLGPPLGSLTHEHYTILNAIDFLLTGV